MPDNARVTRLFSRYVVNPDGLSLDTRARHLLGVKISEGLVPTPTTAHQLGEALNDEMASVALSVEMGGDGVWNPEGSVDQDYLDELRGERLDAVLNQGTEKDRTATAAERQLAAEYLLAVNRLSEEAI